jgi:hypothetical protein
MGSIWRHSIQLTAKKSTKMSLPFGVGSDVAIGCDTAVGIGWAVESGVGVAQADKTNTSKSEITLPIKQFLRVILFYQRLDGSCTAARTR